MNIIDTESLVIHVEGITDLIIVEKILFAAGLKHNVEVIAHNGKENVALAIKKIKHEHGVKHIALIDADSYSVPDSVEEAKKQLGYPDINVYCAVPVIEAWIFADDLTLIEYANNEHVKSILERLPLPEKIPYPKQTAHNIFGMGKLKYENLFNFLDKININRAVSRSPSLRVFLNGVYTSVGKEPMKYEELLGVSIGRNVFSTLLQELPKDKIVWKTLDGGQINAFTLSKEVSDGTELGRQYISDLLRVARDMIARKANK